MTAGTLPGGTFTMAGGVSVTRMGYGAMQLAGPGVFGPPWDRDAAVAVLREAIGLGITHRDTSDDASPVAAAWPGCSDVRRTSCSSPALRRSNICATTSPARRWPFGSPI